MTMNNFKFSLPVKHNNHFALNEFEDALHYSNLKYSMNHLKKFADISDQDILDTIQKSISICSLAKVNGGHHFKKIYVFEPKQSTIYIDYLMSRQAFNLMIMQSATLNKNIARWLWELSAL
jgi:DNA-binding MltR family transcriptional regulator